MWYIFKKTLQIFLLKEVKKNKEKTVVYEKKLISNNSIIDATHAIKRDIEKRKYRENVLDDNFVSERWLKFRKLLKNMESIKISLNSLWKVSFSYDIGSCSVVLGPNSV